MSRVLITYDYFFPAFKAGGPIQSLSNIAKHLSSENEIWVLCTNRDLDNTVLPVVSDEWIDELYLGVKVYYLSPDNKSPKNIYNIIKGIKPDVIYINGLYSVDFCLIPALFCTFARRVVSVRGTLHKGALSQKKYKKTIYLWIWKLLGIHKNCEYHATNEQEKEYIQESFGINTKIWVIPNLPNVVESSVSIEKKVGYLNIATVALISPMKNFDLVLDALSKVKVIMINYFIYGPIKDPEYWGKCMSLIKELPENIKVHYMGEISPILLNKAFEEVHWSILPSKSENYGHSIVESLLFGKPIITSHNTPWNQLELNKAGYNVSDQNSNELVDVIEKVVKMDNIGYQEWSKSSKDYIANRLHVEETVKSYLTMFSS